MSFNWLILYDPSDVCESGLAAYIASFSPKITTLEIQSSCTLQEMIEEEHVIGKEILIIIGGHWIGQERSIYILSCSGISIYTFQMHFDKSQKKSVFREIHTFLESENVSKQCIIHEQNRRPGCSYCRRIICYIEDRWNKVNSVESQLFFSGLIGICKGSDTFFTVFYALFTGIKKEKDLIFIGHKNTKVIYNRMCQQLE